MEDPGKEAAVTSRCKAGPGSLISEVSVTGLAWALGWSIPAQPWEGEQDLLQVSGREVSGLSLV